jgi:glucuronate isomerase
LTLLNPDRLFPPDTTARAIARAIYSQISTAPIISPHGHCDPSWFSSNNHFSNPAKLLISPDHYVVRMLISRGLTFEELGIASADGGWVETDPRKIWRRFAENYYLFRGTPTRLWMDYSFQEVFKLSLPLGPDTADLYYDHISELLTQDAYRPRALFDSFGIEMLATTEGALDPLDHHRALRQCGWDGTVITTYRPDEVTDPEHETFQANLDRFADITGCDLATWAGYLDAHRNRRAYFRAARAVATDHGVPIPMTVDLDISECVRLYARVRGGQVSPEDAGLFRAQMLTEMARMSIEDGMTMQIHPGSQRNYSRDVFQKYGRDRGYDIPRAVNFVDGLAPLLNAVGNEPGLRIVVFTLDEATLSRELAPLAGAFRALLLGPAWWFSDAPDGIKRFREAVTETAGFYNTAGFNDDTRAFPSLPARHDMARRLDAAFLAERVADHRMSEAEAFQVAYDLTVTLPRQTYSLSD